MKNKNKLLDKVLSSKNYNNNLKKYKFSYLNKNEMSLVKVLAAVVFIDNEVDSSELIKVKNILDKLYLPEKSNLLLTAVINKINFYRHNLISFEQDKKLVYNLILKNNVYFDYMKIIFKSNREFSMEEKMFYFSTKHSNDFKYEKLNPKLLQHLELKYEETFKPKQKPKREYYYSPTPTF